MWELFHEEVPFDEDLKVCTDCVLREDVRPAIAVPVEEQEESESEDEDRGSTPPKSMCSAPIALLIRNCWQSDPAARPTFTFILD